MGAMFSRLFSMFAFAFSAGSKVFEACDVLAGSGLAMANQHLANADFERHKQQLELQAKIKALEVELAVPTTPLLVANKK